MALMGVLCNCEFLLKIAKENFFHSCEIDVLAALKLLLRCFHAMPATI